MEKAKCTILDNGYLAIEGLSNRDLIYRNFSGAKDRFNTKGDRKFTVVIPPQDAQRLSDAGWNVKVKPPREDGEDPFCTLEVKIRFDLSWAKPWIMQVTRRGRTPVGEGSINNFDRVAFESVDLVLRPYQYEKNMGGIGTSAQLAEMCGVIQEGYLEAKWAEEEGPGEDDMPFDVN